MGADIEPDGEAVRGTGGNDHAWEREHRHPTPEQARSIGDRRRDAEAKLEQHQQQAREKAEQDEEQYAEKAEQDARDQDREQDS